MHLPELRETYLRAGLRRAELNPDPLAQFQKWMEEALAAKLTEPNAMTLSTAAVDGAVSARTVLLKGLDEKGFYFFTNYQSRKARDLAENPQAALTFLWKDLERQVCVSGSVEKAPRSVSEGYFQSRPWGSQIGAWVSENQSAPIPNREWMEQREVFLEEKFPDEVSLPPFWGGFLLRPDRIEFWQGRPSRLHDRFAYSAPPAWKIDRLSP